MLLAAVALLIGIFFGCFSHIDRFGVFVTTSIVRQVMPRPSQFHSVQREEDGASFADIPSMLTSGYSLFQYLEMSGSATFSSMYVAQDEAELPEEVKHMHRDAVLLCTILQHIDELQKLQIEVGENRKRKGVLGISNQTWAIVRELFCDELESTSNKQSMEFSPRKLAPFTNRAYFFHRPSLTKYGPHQWLWDSCIHICVQSHQDVVKSLLELWTLFHFQNPKTGFLPEMTYWQPDPNQHGIGGWLFGYSDWDRRFTDITQMPIVSMGLQRILHQFQFDNTNSSSVESLLSRAIQRNVMSLFATKLHQLFQYWVNHRDVDGNGMVSIVHPWESGLDASPLYDPVHHITSDTSCNDANHDDVAADILYPKFIVLLYRYRHQYHWNTTNLLVNCRHRFDVEDVGVNSVLAYNMMLLKGMCQEIGMCSEIEESLHQSLKRLVSSLAMNHYESYGWCPGTRARMTLGWPHNLTIQSLFPLLLCQEAFLKEDDIEWPKFPQCSRWLEVLKEDFGMKFGVPSTSPKSPKFKPIDSSLMWRGPSWPTTNWILWNALRPTSIAAGSDKGVGEWEMFMDATRRQLVDSWSAMHLQTGFHEYYNPLTGEGLGQRNLGMSFAIMDTLQSD